MPSGKVGIIMKSELLALVPKGRLPKQELTSNRMQRYENFPNYEKSFPRILILNKKNILSYLQKLNFFSIFTQKCNFFYYKYN